MDTCTILSELEIGTVTEEDKLAMQSAIIEGREAEIKAIHEAMVEANEIMHDLKVLVELQGGQVDRIVDKVAKADNNTKTGVANLQKAEKRLYSRTCTVL